VTERILERFDAQSGSGVALTVLAVEQIVTYRPLRGEPQQLRGATSYRLASGAQVGRLDARTFRVCDTGEIVVTKT
jgi:hypothetical protein